MPLGPTLMMPDGMLSTAWLMSGFTMDTVPPAELVM